MKEKVKTLLQKINLIETDIELQKQILFSIPSAQKDEMETVMKKIKALKDQIQDLRRQIRELDPEEHRRILAMEEATEKFKALAKEKNFVEVRTVNKSGLSKITLNDGTEVESLVAAKDEAGTWTLLTPEGEIKEYPGGLVQG